MTKKVSRLTLTTLALAAALCGANPAWAQGAGGTTTADVSVTEVTQLAIG